MDYLKEIFECDYRLIDLKSEKNIMSKFNENFKKNISYMSDDITEIYNFEQNLFESKKKAVKFNCNDQLSFESKVDISTLGKFGNRMRMLDENRTIIVHSEKTIKSRVKVTLAYEVN